MSIEIRDRREANWFWVSRDLIRRDGKKLGPFGIAIYTALCSHANDEECPWPSIPTLAEEIGCGERKVREVLAQLEALGWIKAEPRYRDDGSQTTNIYWLLPSPYGGAGSREDTGGVPVVQANERESSKENIGAVRRIVERHFAYSPSGMKADQYNAIAEQFGLELFEDACVATVKAGGGHKMAPNYVRSVCQRKYDEREGKGKEDIDAIIAAIEKDVAK